MVILDVDVMLNAFRQDLPHHASATAYLRQLGNSGERIGWHPCLLSAIPRIATRKGYLANPSERLDCFRFIDGLVSLPGAQRVSESTSFWRLFEELLHKYDAVGPAISDFYWAALAIDNGAALCSANRKFGQIKELRWHNLLDYAGS